MQIDFNASERSSLGIEMEFGIVDCQSRQLSSAATEILEALGRGYPDGIHPKAKHELLECTVELITGVCPTVKDARADLETTLAEVVPHLERRGLALMCSGTHPFSHWADQVISPGPRYARLVDELQWPARQLLIFGVHVHVGVRSPEKALAIANGLSTYIPHFLALSASSPFWLGQDTGLASCRSKVFEVLPTGGLPYQFTNWNEFEEFMTTMIAARTISSIREVWWDIRPHPNFGTVELRICDGLPTLGEVATVAALSQCLVEHMNDLFDKGVTLPVPRSWVLRENKWRAARHGIDAEILHNDLLVPLRDAITTLVDELGPVAERLSCREELRAALALIDRGPSYVRQRAVLAATGSLAEVVDSLIAELATDTLTPLLY